MKGSADAVNEVYKLTLRNDRAELPRMVAWIDRIISHLGLPTSTAYALHLCLDEAVINVLSYAFEPDTLHYVHIAVWREGGTLYAEIIDDGRPFDPRSYELPALPKGLMSAQVGGLGIRLIRSSATRICYQRSGSTNRLLLSFPA